MKFSKEEIEILQKMKDARITKSELVCLTNIAKSIIERRQPK